MGKVRGKWKKQVTVSTHENPVSSEEKKITLKRRGRPLKVLKKKTEEKEETKKIESVIDNVAEENEKKRKRSSETEESVESSEQEPSATTDSSVKFTGFRQSGSRRKNKPRRAAVVGVECYCY